MKVQIQKWGNSLALRIPKTFAVETHIGEGSTVEVTLDDRGIYVRPTEMEITLEGLLSDVTEANIHSETDLGEPQGNEVW